VHEAVQVALGTSPALDRALELATVAGSQHRLGLRHRLGFSFVDSSYHSCRLEST
jgi:hypothetical protein